MQDLPGFGGIPLGQEAVGRVTQGDVNVLDGDEVCDKVIGRSKSPLCEQELLAGGA